MVFSVTDLFARDIVCHAINPVETLAVKSMGASAESMNCIATKNQYQCQKLEDELEAADKYKVIKCDSKSLEANRLGNVSIMDCVWNGLKISGESLVDLTKLPGAIAEGIAKGFQQTQFCNASIEKKKEILNAFNMTVDDPRFKLEEKMLGRYLNEASCSEIEKLVFSRYQNYQDTMMRERIAAINTGKKPKPIQLSDKDKEGNLGEMLKSAMASVEKTYQCYTPKVKAEMICAGVTSFLADAALGGGVAMAVKKMNAVVKSARALSRIQRATATGQAVDLADAAVLLKRDRLKAAMGVLKQEGPLSEVQSKAILASHDIGIKEGRGFYEYTKDDILKKARLLREAGFNPEQTRALMEAGITGAYRDNAFYREAMLSYMQKIIKVSTTALQQESLISLHELGMNTSKDFIVKAKEILKKANFSDDQIEKILKAKGDNEKGLLPSASKLAEQKQAEEVAKLAEAKKLQAAADAKKAAEAAKPATPAPATAPAIVDSPGRKAVLANFKDDEVLKFKMKDIPDNLTGEELAAKQRGRKREAQEFLERMEKKTRGGFDIQDNILENGESVKKARKLIAEAEEQMAKLPEKGADMRRKELLDKIERSKTSEEMYQKKCLAILELYRVAHGYEQYMRQYQTDYDRNCK